MIRAQHLRRRGASGGRCRLHTALPETRTAYSAAKAVFNVWRWRIGMRTEIETRRVSLDFDDDELLDRAEADCVERRIGGNRL